ncbi:unnamed protein product [Acanthosepion pharaonis]|uniref:Uncharacterized protein n=1 Tax=Acanthosepion pharaonis TaxID=158019 RepID=A0A812DCA9_ACAPH|nr:unnamed protein product [Sepia pharaonis]
MNFFKYLSLSLLSILSIHSSIYSSIYLSIYHHILSTSLCCACLPRYLCISTCLSLSLPVSLCISLSLAVYLSAPLYLYFSRCLPPPYSFISVSKARYPPTGPPSVQHPRQVIIFFGPPPPHKNTYHHPFSFVFFLIFCMSDALMGMSLHKTPGAATPTPLPHRFCFVPLFFSLTPAFFVPIFFRSLFLFRSFLFYFVHFSFLSFFFFSFLLFLYFRSVFFSFVSFFFSFLLFLFFRSFFF